MSSPVGLQPPPPVGTSLPSRVICQVREEDIRIVALLLRDPNPIHYDIDEVRRLGMGDRAINQGGATMAYVMDAVVSWAGSRAHLRSIDCSFRGSVMAGDDVEVGGIVTDVRADGPDFLVTVDVWADVVGGRRAIAGTSTVVWHGGAS
ncbi:MaoC family dehydratase [Nocardioides sp.]|uniref:MaoC family dehydratase n=1 Tax=Nocardioides sp. TaxID=35761 RepID=UPI00262C559C|nr:MaoC family dehydratase [Nocardioides sp.]MDI6909233.1 MaoC family dehydratase [Nocardioides sp.]